LPILTVFLIAGCGGEEPQLRPKIPNIPPKVNVPPPPQKKDVPKYVYSGSKYRDPFIPLNEKRLLASSSKEVIVPNIESLSLKGIIDDGNEKMALFNAGGMTYILKGNILYDSRRRLVKGLSGLIERDSVTMMDSSKKSKNIKLRN
jgi:hypothetical protein